MGIAYDEPIRIKKHIQKPNVFLPLVATGMWEKDCYKWCEENDLLSPIYSGATRGGVGFVTIKESTNYDNYDTIIQTFGNCFLNGIKTHLLHSMQTDTQSKTSMKDLRQKMTDLSISKNALNGRILNV